MQSLLLNTGRDDLESQRLASDLAKLRNTQRFNRTAAIAQINSPASNMKIIKMMKVKRIVNSFKLRLFENARILHKDSMQYIKFIQEPYLSKDKKKSSNNSYQKLSRVWIMIIWDLICMMNTCLSLWIYPYIVTILYKTGQEFVSLELWINAQLLADIAMSFNRSIVSNGELYTDHWNIIQIYIKQNVLYDSSIILIWLTNYVYKEQPLYLRAIFCIIFIGLNVRRLIIKLSLYLETMFVKGTLHDLIDLGQLIITIYFFAHIIACIWYTIAEESQYLGTSWVIEHGIEDAIHWQKYNYAFYWATMTMTTIGYGDITATNAIEVFMCSIIMFCSTCLFGYSINSIGMIVTNLNESDKQYKQKLAQINQYMDRYSVAQQIQYRVRNYLKHQISESANSDQDSELIVNTLPQELKLDLKNDIYSQIFKEIPLITRIFSIETQKQIQELMGFSHYTPHEVIYHQKTNNQNLYYIVKGAVKIIEEQSGFQLNTLKIGDCFGQYQYFTGMAPKSTAITTETTILCKFARKDLLDIIKTNSADLEKYSVTYHNVIFNRRLNEIEEKCSFCTQCNHMSIECPQITYQADLEKIIKRQDFMSNQRAKYRRQREKYNIFDQLEFIRDSCQTYQQKMEHNPYPTQPSIKQSNIFTNTIIKEQSEENDDQSVQIKETQLQSDELSDDSVYVQQIPKLNLIGMPVDRQKIDRLPRQAQGTVRMQNKKFTFSVSRYRERSSLSSPGAQQSPLYNKQLSHSSEGYITMYGTQYTEFNMNNTRIDDKAKEYAIFFPEANLSRVLSQFLKLNKKFKAKLTSHKYSFYILVQLLSSKMRKKGNLSNIF